MTSEKLYTHEARMVRLLALVGAGMVFFDALMTLGALTLGVSEGNGLIVAVGSFIGMNRAVALAGILGMLLILTVGAIYPAIPNERSRRVCFTIMLLGVCARAFVTGFWLGGFANGHW
jgi:hypothetical protein